MDFLDKLRYKAKNLLVWSQKHTRTDMLYLAKGGFWLSLGQVISSALTLIVAILLANLVPKETYGTYKYVLSIASILLIAALPQMGSAIVQAVARGYEGSLMKAIGPMLKWGSLGSLAAAGLAAYYYLNGNHLLAWAFLIVTVFLPFFSTFNVYDALLSGRKLFDVSTKYAVVLQAISTVVLVLAAVLTKNILWILGAYFGSRTIVALSAYFYVLKKFRPNRLVDPQVESYGKHLTLMGVVSTVANYLDQVLVYHFLGPAQLAVYAIAISPPEQVKGFLSGLDTLMFPNFSQRDSRKIRAEMGSKFVRLFILGVVVVTAYILVAPMAFRLVFPKYPESVLYSQLFALSMLNLTFAPAVTYLKAKRKIREQYYISIFSSVFQIVTMTACVIKWGLLGLVVARVLSRYLSALINLFYYHRVGPEDIATESPAPASLG